MNRLITCLLIVPLLCQVCHASDRKQRGRSAWAWASSVRKTDTNFLQKPSNNLKVCPCSNECVCGCNSGKPCDCNKVKAATVIESATCTTGT